jgi:hypothetical protein
LISSRTEKGGPLIGSSVGLSQGSDGWQLDTNDSILASWECSIWHALSFIGKGYSDEVLKWVRILSVDLDDLISEIDSYKCILAI